MRHLSDRQQGISVVVTGRNDGYGGDFVQRMQTQVDWFTHWAERYGLAMEYVVVEYNPPADAPSLSEVIHWPQQRKHVHYRLLRVDASLHAAVLARGVNKPLPLIEFVAKNIGIRRAKKDWILSTNADVLPDPVWFRWLAEEPERNAVLYRADRFDFHRVEDLRPDMESLRRIRANCFEAFLQGRKEKVRPWMGFMASWRYAKTMNAFWRMRQWLKKHADRLLQRIGVHLWVVHDELFFHCNAAGDFLLLDKESWHAVKGFPEDGWISTHTDSLLVVRAMGRGVDVSVQPWPVYHQAHERRFVFDGSNPDMDRMYARLQDEMKHLRDTGNFLTENREDWGMGDEAVEETAF